MKFLFVNKPPVMEPLGIMYLSSVIKGLGHETDLAITSEDLEKKVAEFNPDFVGYSIITGDEKFYDEINRKLKSKFKFVSIVGGPHPTFFPEFLESSSFDSICIGEGEKAIQQFLANPSSYEIPNFWIKDENGKVIKNPVQPLIENLDNIPFPDREIVSGCPQIKETPIKHFIASRGCPYNCTYCFNKSFSELYEGKGKRVRFRSVQNLLEEIKQTNKAYPKTRLNYFQDDTFTLNDDWLEEFAEGYASRIKKPFHCHVRANTLTERKVSNLEKAGCYSVHFAIETGNDELRNKILNRGMSKEQIISAVELLRKHGIKFVTQNMIGIPGGNLENDLETLELNRTCKPDYAWVSIFQPYPGTALGRLCKEEGYYDGDFTDLNNNFYESSKLNFSEEYKSQLSHLQKLFALFVEMPRLYHPRLVSQMINAPQSEYAKNIYQKAYKDFRKRGDRRIYGFDVK
jgi:anaerobic magnesium-protoporphyrin IX monomethyl ester cyclase